MYINKKTYEVLEGVIPKGIDWVEIPRDAEAFVVWDDPFQFAFYKDGFKKVNVATYPPNDKRCWEECENMNLEHVIRFGGEVVWERGVGASKQEGKPFNPLDVQEGGNHYKERGIQPIEYTEANKLNFQQGNVVKYITRHKEKNGVEDLSKVVHYALLEAYFVYGVEGSTKLKQKILKMLGEGD